MAISISCRALQIVLPKKVSFPSNVAYQTSLGSYWSAQEQDLSPSCIVAPKSSKDVSIAVVALSLFNRVGGYVGLSSPFAVRGGGHTPWAGSANIANGVVIDLSAMKDVKVNSDQSVTSLGPGLRWVEVYSKLDSMGLAVLGGRVADVGVAGLTLGGGISFFSGQYGFVCDNVENYEVVLASGKVVNVNTKENHDLWLALKGGSNNFGIVTRFDVKTIKHGESWGGNVINTIDTRFDQFRAFEGLNNATSDDDQRGALINSYAFGGGQPGFSIVNNLHYTKPEAYPALFKPFTDIQPQVYNNLRISNLSDFTRELEQPGSLRERFTTITVGNKASILEEAFNIFNSTLQTVIDAPGLVYALSLQAIPSSIRQQSTNLGGNSLGIPPSEGPLCVILLSTGWSDITDDDRLEAAAKSWYAQLSEAARASGLDNDWIYLNYAAEFQDPIKGYGVKNKANLQAVSRKYDPSGIFQKAVPGGFKLF
ncbi:MAG: methionyl-tRNA synthetase [Chaenotheca gracillima]|nr:MAG: methionyl-tRNA synthetase [Chaenotheca gracillima]